MYKLIVPISILITSGCATNSEAVLETARANARVVQAEAQKYLLDAKIPTPLGVMEVKVANPERSQLASVSDPGAEALRAVAELGRDAIQGATTIYGIKAGGTAAASIASVVGSAVTQAGAGPDMVNSNNTTIDNSDNRVDNTNNGVTDSDVSRFNSDNNSVSEPTVVTQPSPVIVQPTVVKPEVVTVPSTGG